ncbi:ComF family protein [Rossellomorea aquimaris]|uniref:ComF family protein n=1 Tax=Rossellomorea aquimaris TaxID=189382 RepID=UPI0007D0B697|nr:ComF family protein [Rossellomorea aquimaris]
MENSCLYCAGEIVEVMSWCSIFSKEKSFLCVKCESQLEKIKGKRCRVCSRSLETLPPELIKGEVCFDCFRWESDPKWQGILHNNTSIFYYNDFLKDYLAQYKYRGDYELAKSFTPHIKSCLKSLHFDIIIPIPLSKKRLYERGFNQSTALLEKLEVRPSNNLSRTHSEKQSKKSRRERLVKEQVFRLDESNVEGKSILLFDDIYTTGTTLRQAARILKVAGAVEVSSLTVARG